MITIRPLQQFNHDYLVADTGEIVSIKRGLRILKPIKNTKGYLRYNLCGKNVSGHRLVAQKFIPNPDNLPQVNHINEIKTDNRVENLEWCTNHYNAHYGNHFNKIKEKQTANFGKPIKCVETGVIYPSIKEACRQNGIRHSNLQAVVQGRTRTAGGYHWSLVR